MGTLARGISINLFGTGFNIVGRLLYNVLVARLLGPGNVGIYYLVLTVADLVGVVAAGGLETTIVRYLAWHRVDCDWGAFRGTLRFAIRVASVLALAGTLGLLVLAPQVTIGIFHKPAAVTPLRIIAVMVPLYALETLLLAATQSFNEMKYKALIESMLNPALRLVLLVPAFFLNARLYYILSIYSVPLFVCTVLAYLALRRCIPVDLRAYQPRTNYRDLVHYSYPLFFFKILTLLTLYSDSLFVAHFMSSAMMGIYSVCIRLVIVTSFILPVINQTWAPLMAESYRKRELGKVSHNFKLVTLWALQIYIPVLLVFLIAPGWILDLFGRGFRAAAPCLVILMIGQFINNLTGPVGLVLTISGWTRLQLWNAFTVVVLQSVLAVLLIPKLGLVGAAIANASAAVLVNLVRVIQVWNRLRMQPFSACLLKPVLAGGSAIVVAAAVLHGASFVPMMKFILAIAGSMVTYVAAMWFLGFDANSRMAWRQLRGAMGRALAQAVQSKL